jgi:Spy/CpxP family protein refolding chaperone
MNNANLSKFKDQMGEAKHQYNEIEKQTIEELIASGQIDRSAFEEGKARKLANRQVSLGYAFITFSHADEAKQALMIMDGEFYLDHSLV